MSRIDDIHPAIEFMAKSEKLRSWDEIRYLLKYATLRSLDETQHVSPQDYAVEWNSITISDLAKEVCNAYLKKEKEVEELRSLLKHTIMVLCRASEELPIGYDTMVMESAINIKATLEKYDEV